MLRWGLALTVIIGLSGGLLLGVLNADPVTLDLGVVRWTASLGAVVAATAGAALLIGLLLGLMVVGSGRRRKPAASRARDLPPSSTTHG